MKTLIVYDSEYGNTKQIAEAIADVLRQHGSVTAKHVDLFHHDDLRDIDVLVVGCPTQAWHATAPIREFLGTLQPHFVDRIQVACFDTRFNKPRWLTGSAAHHMAAICKQQGFKLLAAPESFFIQGREGPLGTGELRRAAVWGWVLVQAYENQVVPEGAR
jgi:flavodoxin